jgi:hypothetical protein
LAANETSIKQLGKYRENVICRPGAIILLPRDINNAARAHKTYRTTCARWSFQQTRRFYLFVGAAHKIFSLRFNESGKRTSSIMCPFSRQAAASRE